MRITTGIHAGHTGTAESNVYLRTVDYPEEFNTGITSCWTMRILLTDEAFDAKEALRINLINEVVPHDQLMSRSEEIATRIAGMPPIAVRMMKEFAIRFRDIPVSEAWRVQTLFNTLLTQLTTDGDEGRKAFLENRPPNFTGGIRPKAPGFPELTAEERALLEETRRELFG